MDEKGTDEQKCEAPRRWGGEKTVQALIVLPLLLASVLYLNVARSPSKWATEHWYCKLEYAGVFSLLWVLVAAAAISGSSVKAYKILNGIKDLPPGVERMEPFYGKAFVSEPVGLVDWSS